MNLGVVGCGHVADSYGCTLANYSNLRLSGAFDTNVANAATFCRRWPARQYASLEDLLQDPSVEIVLNLTNPRSHYDVTKRCLDAGKHVYSEKPLAMDSGAARELAALAATKKVYLGAAPCSVLGETAQTIWKAINDGVIGRVRLIYANFDDGMIAPAAQPWRWLNDAGVAWPAKDEFEVGCTFEHAGYLLTWLAAFFGQAMRVTAFSSCQLPDKGIEVDVMAPDFSVGCIEYPEGIVARLTCGLVAPRDKSLTIIGDDGVIFTNNVRNDASPVYVKRIPGSRLHIAVERRINPIRMWLENALGTIPWSGREWQLQRQLPLTRKPSRQLASRIKPVDFCRGPAEMAEAIEQGRPCRLSADLAVHIMEVLETLQYPERFRRPREIEAAFRPICPLPWMR
uniref:Oxidoreductase domain protein n=1 Tax=Solibacter usitatus (strain Ellin6076) TaxID=234267 RepID=Q01XL2_SOLUE